MTIPSDPDVVRELRARAAAGIPAMSLDAAAVRAAGRRRLKVRRWVAGGGAFAAALVLVAVVITAGSFRPSVTPVGTTSAAPCMTAPTVEYTAPGGASRSLPVGATVKVTAAAGQPVTVRFVGDCAAGGMLMINDAGSGQGSGYTDVWNGQIAGNWTPTESGTRTLMAAWSCSGPTPCPLAMLGYIEVTTPGPGTGPTTSPATPATRGQADSVTRTTCYPNNLLSLGSLGGASIADGLGFSPMAVLGSQVFGQFNTAQGPGVGVYDTSSGTFTRIASYAATASGLDGMSADGHWVAWTESDSTTALSQWRMWAWDTETRKLTELASSHPAGGGAAVGTIWGTALVSGQSAIWTQQVGTAADSPLGEVRVRDLESGTTRVLDRGQVSPPVRAGGLIMWSTIAEGGSAGSQELRAVSATTLEPAKVPVGLQQLATLLAPSGTPNEVGVGDANGQTYRVYSVNGELKHVLQLPSQFADSSHAFQFVQLQGNHMIWDSPTGTILANLDSGVAVVLPEFASAYFLGTSVFVSYSPVPSTSKAVPSTSNVALIDWPISDTEHC